MLTYATYKNSNKARLNQYFFQRQKGALPYSEVVKSHWNCRFSRFCTQTSRAGFYSADQVFSLFPLVPRTNTYGRQTVACSTHLEYRTPNATTHTLKLKHVLFQYA